VGQQEIVSPGRVPTIGERSEDFADWGGGSVYRPLVANSQPYFNDPESWRPVPPAADLAALLRKQFREKFPKIENCKKSGRKHSETMGLSRSGDRDRKDLFFS
jgi:hypothetical protein